MNRASMKLFILMSISLFRRDFPIRLLGSRLRHRAGWIALPLLLSSCAPATAQRESGTFVVPPASASTASKPQTKVPELAARIDAIISRPPLNRAHWGIEIWDPASRLEIYSRNAQKHFVPASTLKLVVSSAALHLLSPEYRYITTIYGVGAIRSGTLEGDLVLYGRGDPMLSGRYAPTQTAIFEALADSLYAQGLRRISGSVVGDESFWDAEYTRGDWESYDLLWWYAAPVSALGFNDNSIDFRVAPGARVGQPARITWQPETSFLRFENRTVTVAAGRPNTLDFSRVPGTDRVVAYGEIPLDAAARTEYFAVEGPARYAATVFREVLERRGIRIVGSEVRVNSDARTSVSKEAQVLAEHRSPPLAHVIGPILGTSQNWFAEQLVKTLGRERRGEGSWKAGLAVEREFLTSVVGIDPSAFVLRDGSGLSGGNLITPHALVQLLAFAREMPNADVFRQALPVSGRSGSLRARLTDLPSRVAAKTGYIGNVDALSGYITLADGRELIFSVVANASGQPSSRVKSAIDEIVRAIAAADP
jgi:D-alanyl-D-alanine carboxypeptidase/D-alanyl-D-alanine-endopeptidase (penicillin-binding protein 4)